MPSFKRFRKDWTIPRPSGFLPHPALKYCLLTAVVLSALMAILSDYNRHPDELCHYPAAVYYLNHILPPVIGDPAVRDSYSVWGVSYLNYHWAEYFFAGKFIWFVSPLIHDSLLAARLFNVFLFASLFVFFFVRSRSDPSPFIIPCLFLITPQVWYIFSYSNNDAFALFIATLIAYQLVYSRSVLSKFLENGFSFHRLFGGIWFGVLLGLLAACKPNYWVFLLFVAFWLLINRPTNWINIRKYGVIAVIAMSLFSFRIGLDFYVNGETNFAGASYINYFFGGFETKPGKLLAYQEEVAEYKFKPSTWENDLANSREEVKLKAKGTTAIEMFRKWRFHNLSFNSFTGGYGYMSLWAPRLYYDAMLVLYLALGLYLTLRIFRSKDRIAILQLMAFGACSMLAVLISFYLSWNYAFQPQGRYLFPIIPMAAMLIYSTRKLFHNFLVNGFIAAAFLLSAYSFIFVALARVNSE